jgi:hypothetical protein
MNETALAIDFQAFQNTITDLLDGTRICAAPPFSELRRAVT